VSILKGIKKVFRLFLSEWTGTDPSSKRRKRTKRTAVKKKSLSRSIKKVTSGSSRKKQTSSKKKPTQKKAAKVSLKKKPVINVKPVKKVSGKRPLAKKTLSAQKRSAGQNTAKKRPETKTRIQPSAKLKRLLVGEVTHYFDKVCAAAFQITGAPIRLGDALEFEGKGGVFRQEIKSLQINRVPVKSAQAGDEVGLLVKKPVESGIMSLKYCHKKWRVTITIKPCEALWPMNT